MSYPAVKKRAFTILTAYLVVAVTVSFTFLAAGHFHIDDENYPGPDGLISAIEYAVVCLTEDAYFPARNGTPRASADVISAAVYFEGSSLEIINKQYIPRVGSSFPLKLRI